VLAGVSSEAREDVGAFLSDFGRIGLEPDIADRAARLRREHRWALPDAFQAASALHHGRVLVNRNTRDFQPDRLALHAGRVENHAPVAWSSSSACARRRTVRPCIR